MADTEDGNKYSLGQNAADAYEQLTSGRQQVVDMGRLMAELTIPSVFPPEGYQPGDNLPGNNQSIGAQCVNSLASKLMFTAFPPGQPIMRLEPVEYKVQEEVDNDPELWGRIELGLSRLELAHRKRLSTTTIATAYVEYLKLLLVAGNALWKHMQLANPTYHRPDCYVVRRNNQGVPLLTIHKEVMSLQSMDVDHRAFIEDTLKRDGKADFFGDKEEWEKTVEVYSVCKLKVTAQRMTWCYWEEWEGHTLPRTSVETDVRYPPMWPGWLIPVFGSNWGRGYCEEYRGDLFTVEAQSSATNDGAALAALSLLFVKPGSQTSIRQVREAKNLSMLPGNADDISVFRSDKIADYQFVLGVLDKAERRLAIAFLLEFSIQRQGERVTAEEIKRLARALDQAMGGTYTMVAQGNQKVVIMRAVRLHEDENPELPEIPEDVVEVQVVTGVDAMGQSSEADNLVEWGGTFQKLYPTTFEKITDGRDFGTRLAAAKGIKPDGLVKKPEQIAEEAQQDQMAALSQSLVDKGTGPAIKGMADAAQAPQTLQ